MRRRARHPRSCTSATPAPTTAAKHDRYMRIDGGRYHSPRHLNSIVTDPSSSPTHAVPDRQAGSPNSASPKTPTTPRASSPTPRPSTATCSATRGSRGRAREVGREAARRRRAARPTASTPRSRCSSDRPDHRGPRRRMRILVTGAGGFIGGHLVPELEHAGHDVWGTSVDLDDGDLTEPGVARGSSATAAADVVVHLAAQVGRQFGEDDVARDPVERADDDARRAGLRPPPAPGCCTRRRARCTATSATSCARGRAARAAEQHLRPVEAVGRGGRRLYAPGRAADRALLDAVRARRPARPRPPRAGQHAVAGAPPAPDPDPHRGASGRGAGSATPSAASG
jgi:hypothetical protein